MPDFDVIVIGAGSAGEVLVGRTAAAGLSTTISEASDSEIGTTDSNVWGGRSGHVYTLAPQDGTTLVTAVVTPARSGRADGREQPSTLGRSTRDREIGNEWHKHDR